MTIRDRIFRSAVVAVVGALAGLVLTFSLDLRRPFAADGFLLEAALIGGGVGAILGFIFSDSDWLNLIRKR
jgi:hypothetical protein